jgi:hypothetical protein
MIQGQIEAISVKPFVTKAGVDMFKIGIKVDGTFYNTVSKFADTKYKKGDQVFFETQEQYPDSIMTGTVKIINNAFESKKTTAPATTGQTVLINSMKREIEDLKRRLKEAQDDASLKELDNTFNDDIPF